MSRTFHQKASAAYALVKSRHDAGQNPLSNDQIAWELGYSSQISIVPCIPLMQRMAQAEGLYLARPIPANNWCLTITSQDEPEMAMLAEIARDKNRATRQRNNVLSELLETLSHHTDPQISAAAEMMADADKMAVYVDGTRRKRLRDLEKALVAHANA